MKFLSKNGKGLLLCLGLAIPSCILGKMFPVIGGPVFAILIGMVLALVVKKKEPFEGGVKFTSKKILQYAVVLLGFGMNLEVVMETGKQSLPIIICTITTSLVIAFVLHRAMNIPEKISTLVGVGSSICGGSAIAATAPVIDADEEEVAQAISVIFLFNIIPEKISTLVGVGSSICGGSAIAATAPVIDADEEEVAQAISVIFLFNILAALIFPALGAAIGFSTTSGDAFGVFAGTAVNDTSSVTAAASTWDSMYHLLIFPALGAAIGFSTTSGDAFGVFAGTAVNDTSSVTAAASTWDSMYHLGSQTLDKAVTVKLTRTLAIIPITLVLAVRRAKKAENQNGEKVSLKKVFPFFILFFIGASVITTVAVAAGVPIESFQPLKELSKFFIVMAMGAIGFHTDIVKLVKSGGKPNGGYRISYGYCKAGKKRRKTDFAGDGMLGRNYGSYSYYAALYAHVVKK